MASQFEVRIQPEALARLLRGQDGPVGRWLLVQGDRVTGEAKSLVGKDTHALENSIVKRATTYAGELAVLVGTFSTVAKRYAMWHHEGTRPHVILPRFGQVLRFVTKGGAVVFARRVNHPGTRPNRYLVNALRVLRR